MYRKLLFSLCLVLFTATMVSAYNKGSAGENKTNKTNKTSETSQTTQTTQTSQTTGTSETGETGGTNEASGAADTGAKTLRGMSVLGNDEAPMSLFIVPWKSSELGVETNLQRTLDERDVPVDRDVFKRELDFYQVSVGGKGSER